MKKITKLFTLLMMAAMSMGAMANTAILSWNMGVDGAAATGANSITGASGCAAEGFTIAITGNTGKNWSAGNGSITFNEVSYSTLKNSNGAQNTVTLPSGYEAQSVTFYATTNADDADGVLSEFNGASCSDAVTSRKDYENPTVIAKDLENATSFTFTFSSKQVCFIAVVEYRAQPIVDPARIYTFGVTSPLESTVIGDLVERVSGCANVTTGLVNTYGTLGPNSGENPRQFFHGGETAYNVATTCYRNMTGSTMVKTQNDAEDNGAYIGFTLNVAAGNKLSIRQITSDLYVEGKSNWFYEYVVENNEHVEVYKSPIQTIATAQSGTGHSNTISVNSDALRGLTGDVTVKLIWWINSGGACLAVKDFNVSAVDDEITSQTKALKAIEVNGEDYDYVNEGNTIDALYHAAPEVKFYYDVKNNWSDGSQTDAADENETIVASVSGDDYVAATTMLETPYSLTFTNIDLPKRFGMGREFEDATHFESGVEKLMGTAPAHVTVALHNGAGLDHTDGNKDLCHGTTATVATPTAYRNHCYATDALANAVFLDNFYWGFSVDVAVGYSMSISQIYGDMYAQKNKIQYKMGVYTSDADDAEPLYMSEIKEGTITTMGEENVPMTVNTSEIAALQGLKGKVYFRFYWNIASTAANAALKDFNISAVVERVPGEGVTGLVFTDFTPAPQPVFTEGEVTAVWSRNIGGNISPDVKDEVKRGIRVQAGYDYTMQLTVPGDSYISEVVFVWNKNGNKTAEINPDYFINFSIRNSSDVEVSTLQYGGAKIDETVWSCGDIKESVLKFVQGAGDFYCHSIRVTYLKKPASTTYVRSHVHMNLNTLCFPYQIDNYTGATFYTMLYKVVDGSGDALEVVLQEHVGALAAGQPYFYVPEGSELVCEYSGAYTAAGNDGNGVYGSYTDNAAVASGMYVTYNNQIVKAGTGVQLREYRAYINMDEVSGSASPVPGRRLLRIGNAANAPTGVENVQGDKVQSTKVLRNGQLYLMYNGTMYDVQGRMVK